MKERKKEKERNGSYCRIMQKIVANVKWTAENGVAMKWLGWSKNKIKTVKQGKAHF